MVADISDEELLRRVIRGLKSRRTGYPRPLWAVVSEVFALGSTYSMQLCRRFGLDPDEGVRG